MPASDGAFGVRVGRAVKEHFWSAQSTWFGFKDAAGPPGVSYMPSLVIMMRAEASLPACVMVAASARSALAAKLRLRPRANRS
jgi:hypothetical protein